MRGPVALREVDLSRPIAPLGGLSGSVAVRVLVRIHGTPLGQVDLPVVDGGCAAEALAGAMAEGLQEEVLRELAERALAAPLTSAPTLRERLEAPPPAVEGTAPTITVAVCTRDRTPLLQGCLEALEAQDRPPLDVLVVDNAPADDTTARLLAERFPRVRRVLEPRPGLDHARNRALQEARGEVVAFTDDDARPDRGWVRALGEAFLDPEIEAVTGLVLPDALDTEAERLFEAYGGFARGFERRWPLRVHPLGPPPSHVGAGQFGTGANMAFRRETLLALGGFHPALDVGTPSRGGGDLEMFFRTLAEGRSLLYEPRALVRHRHRADLPGLRRQIEDWGRGMVAHLAAGWTRYPGERARFRGLLRWWLRRWIAGRAWGALRGRLDRRLLRLIAAEARGALAGWSGFRRSVRENGTPPERSSARAVAPPFPGSVREVEIGQGVRAVPAGLADGGFTRLHVLLDGEAVGTVNLLHAGRPVSPVRLRDAIARSCPRAVLGAEEEGNVTDPLRRALLGDRLAALTPRAPRRAPLPAGIGVSVVVATRDRPDDLAACLASLAGQGAGRPVELIVVDNHPRSGRTPPVVARFPGVRLVSESRGGLSYARNAGFAAASHPIVAATDDDVTAPPGWLERLVAPFADRAVGAVTGNVLPAEAATRSQVLFEEYGGLGRGFRTRWADAGWFRGCRDAVPVWSLGATANAAFRRSVLDEVGPLDEALGAGTPTGCSEDTDLFYRILRAGHVVSYEPAAWVLHRHRAELASLRRQIYAYSKGHVASHLLTIVRYGDLRPLRRLLLSLPSWHARRLVRRLLGRIDYPYSLILLEAAGNLAGPWALLRSRRRVRRLGRSEDAWSTRSSSGSSGARPFTGSSAAGTGCAEGPGAPTTTSPT